MEQKKKRRAASNSLPAPIRYNKEQVKYSMLAYFEKLKKLEQEYQEAYETHNSEVLDVIPPDSGALTSQKNVCGKNSFRRKLDSSKAVQNYYLYDLCGYANACTALFEEFQRFKPQVEAQNRSMETQLRHPPTVGTVQRSSSGESDIGLVRCNLSAANLSFLLNGGTSSYTRDGGKVLRSKAVVPHRSYVDLRKCEKCTIEPEKQAKLIWFDGSLRASNGVTLLFNNGTESQLLKLEAPVQQLISGTAYYSSVCGFESGAFDARDLAPFVSTCQRVMDGENQFYTTLCFLGEANLLLSQQNLLGIVLCDLQNDSEDVEQCLDVCVASLQELVISNCGFANCCVRCDNLHVLHIICTRSASIPPAMHLFSARCGAERVSGRFGPELRFLRRLSLENCDISGMDITNARMLEYLSLRRSVRVPLLGPAVLPLYLTELDCYHACMRVYPRLTECAALVRIVLSDTRLKRLDCAFLPASVQEMLCARTGLRKIINCVRLTALRVLNLQENALTGLDVLPYSLEALFLSQNPVESLNGAENATFLYSLDVTGICGLEQDFWFISYNLRELDASNCRIRIMPDIRHFEALCALNLNGNPGLILDPVTLPAGIQCISLQNCALKAMPNLARFEMLYSIDIGFNRDICIAHCCIPAHLTLLALPGCALEHIYVGNAKIDKIDATGNPLQFFFARHAPRQFISDTLVDAADGLMLPPQVSKTATRALRAALRIYDNFTRLQYLQAYVNDVERVVESVDDV